MPDMPAGIFARIAELQAAGKSVALATVVRTVGSVPRHEGTRMLIFPDGQIEGTVGGVILRAASSGLRWKPLMEAPRKPCIMSSETLRKATRESVAGRWRSSWKL